MVADETEPRVVVRLGRKLASPKTKRFSGYLDGVGQVPLGVYWHDMLRSCEAHPPLNNDVVDQVNGIGNLRLNLRLWGRGRRAQRGSCDRSPHVFPPSQLAL